MRSMVSRPSPGGGPAEAARVEAHDLVGVGQPGRLRVPHGEAQGERVQEQHGRSGSPDLVGQLRARDR